MKRLKTIIYLCVLFPMIAWAKTAEKVPSELMYNGKPIDPICLFEIENAKAKVDLSKCGLNLKKGYQVADQNKKLIAEGFVGYNYTWKLNNAMDMGGYSYYKVLGYVGHAVLVQTINKTGGTGSFSFLSLVKREGDDFIKVTVLNGGDRCNGSLVDAKRVGKGANERVVYSVSITPYDFLTLSDDNPYSVKAYDDLSACAVCCAGKAVYERSIGKNFANEKLLYVDVSTYLQNIGHSQASQPDQICFDKVLAVYGHKNHGKLDPKQLSLFTHEFNKTCVRHNVGFLLPKREA